MARMPLPRVAAARTLLEENERTPDGNGMPQGPGFAILIADARAAAQTADDSGIAASFAKAHAEMRLGKPGGAALTAASVFLIRARVAYRVFEFNVGAVDQSSEDVPRELAPAQVMGPSVRIKLSDLVTVQGSHDAEPRKHRGLAKRSIVETNRFFLRLPELVESAASRACGFRRGAPTHRGVSP